MIQTSCSELLVGTELTDPQEAYGKLSALFAELQWASEPALSLELLMRVKQQWEDYEHTEEDKPDGVLVYDSAGNRAWLEYGFNGYLSTGFRLDTSCNHGDEKCYPLFKVAIERLQGELIACDGGSTDCYERWLELGGSAVESGEDDDGTPD